MALPDIELKARLQTLAAFTARLTELGYQAAPIAKLLGRWDVSELHGKEYPNYIWRCEREDTDLARLVRLFLLGQALDPKVVENYFGEDLMEELTASGIMATYKGVTVSFAVIFPCRDMFFFTDQWVGTGGKQQPGKVYELGTDSYILARVTPRRNVKRALDLCTGSGVHAVLSAAAASEVSKAVDINPRALNYTKFNAALNGVKCETYLGDLYDLVEGETFDLITANPPFVPSPDPDVLIHRSAGESGEEIPERLVAGLPQHLEVGGLFSMVLDHPVLPNESYVDRLERWLGETQGWGIAVLTFTEFTLANYIKSHLQGVEDYEETFRSYLDSYLAQSIESVESANVFILRLGTEAPNWKFNQKANWPNVGIVPQVEEWLDGLRTYLVSDFQPDPDWKPTLGPSYKSLWRDWHGQRGALEMADDNWFPTDPLNADECELLFRMRDGVSTVEELRKGWLSEGKSEDSFLLAFRGLGARRALK